MNAEHLTKKQIAQYTENILEQNESQKIGTHLIQCTECRKLLPTPSLEQFWNAVEKETDDLQYQTPQKSILSEFFPTVFSSVVLRPSNAFALSVGSFLVLISFSALLLYGLMNNSSPIKEDVVQLSETQKTDNVNLSSEKIPDTSIEEAAEDINEQSDSQISSESSNPIAETKTLKKKHRSTKIIEKKTKIEDESEIELVRLMSKTPQSVSSLRSDSNMVLRGKSNNVDKENNFKLTFPVGTTVLEENPEFRWEKVEGSKGYKISIFDSQFNEILTAEVIENRYQIEKPLKSGEKYLWRVAAITANGEIIAPKPPQPPVIFRIAERKTAEKVESLKKKKDDPLKLAIFYVEEGMIDSAYCTLKEILAKNPKHKAARRLMIKVIEWQKENQADVHRCGPTAPTATKPAQ